MERVTISLEDTLLLEFDAFIKRKGYANRSEAIRDLLRDRLGQDRQNEDRVSSAVGCLSYVFNHHQRELSRRVTEAQHARHDLVLSTLHVHLDHDTCLEIAVLKGAASDVRGFADSMMAETGVHYGNLHLISTPNADHDHGHGHAHGHEDDRA